MRLILTGADVYMRGGFSKSNIAIENGRIISLSPTVTSSDGDIVKDVTGYSIFPGFTDVHVHFREPGFFYKETIKTGSMAAARGGYTTVCTMPNLNPCPDCAENLKIQTEAIDRDAVIRIVPYGTITKGENGQELSDMEDMAPCVAGFSDDGRGVQKEDMMRLAMNKAKSLNKPIVAHCEDNTLLFGGYIHAGKYAKEHNHRGICSESEWKQIERDIALAEETGCQYHVCHISTKESVDLIRYAKARGVKITCETAPHYLVLDENDLREEGRFKMNPPLRSTDDRLALIEGLKDGTIDCIATDHAPHSAEEKSRGLEKSLMGVVGLETAFSVLYTKLVKNNVVPLERIIDAITARPNEIFGFDGGEIKEGSRADLAVFDLNKCYKIDSSEFLSQGKSTPFEGFDVFGRNMMTIADGRIVWQERERR